MDDEWPMFDVRMVWCGALLQVQKLSPIFWPLLHLSSSSAENVVFLRCRALFFFSFKVLAPEQARIALFRISTLGRCQEENTQSEEVPRNAACSVLA